MIIEKMSANFGRLQNQTLELGPGLNLLEGPNEAGKSTWSAFLRAMFYGVPTRERDRQGFLAEKNRYQPWSGVPMEGSMDLIWHGQSLTLRRGPKGSAPFQRFEALDRLTGEAVPSLTGEGAGEWLLGVPREVFERSAFVGQGGTAVDGSPALERRIAALVSSGEEDISFSQVQRRLKDWQNRRRYNQTGQIPRLEEELRVLEDALTRQVRAHRQAEEARREIQALSAERTRLEAGLAAHRCAENRERRRRYEQAQADLRSAQEAAGAIRDELYRYGPAPDREALKRAQEDLNYLNTLNANIKLAESQIDGARREAALARQAAGSPIFPDLSPEDAWRQVERDEARIGAEERQAERCGKWLRMGPLLALTAGATAGLLCHFLFSLPPAATAAAAAAVLLLAAAGFLLPNLWTRRQARTQVGQILSRYGASHPEELRQSAEQYQQSWSSAQEAECRAGAVEASLADLAAQRDGLRTALLDLTHAFAPQVTDIFGVSAALSRALALDEKYTAARMALDSAKRIADSLPPPASLPDQAGPVPEQSPQELAARRARLDQDLSRLRSVLAMAQGELATLGEPALFQSRRESLMEDLARRRAEHAALETALEALEQANGSLQSRFSPDLNRLAGEILSALTGGRYNAVTLTRDFDATAQEMQALLPRRAIALSQGTMDQIYLAVRLAVCHLALPVEEPVPLVLDDALANFDDRRMALALDYLLQLSQTRQLLLFTCHSREGRYLEGRSGVRRIELAR